MNRIPRFFTRPAGLILLVAVAFVLGMLLRGGGERPPAGSPTHDHAGAAASADEPTIWTCSMHPQIRLPEPGQCPICFMDLIPLASGGEDELGPRTLEMSDAAAALAEIRTAPVRREFVSHRVELVGKVTYDETRYRTISAWVAGRIDTLFVDFTGTTVAKGDALVSIYSPDVYAAQVELLGALQAQQELQRSRQETMRRTAAATVDAARERLRLWGLTAGQIAAIEERGTPTQHVTVTAPIGGVVVHKDAVEGMYVQSGTRIYTVADLSRVWVDLDAYESDLPWLEEGQEIDFTVAALPGERFTGTVAFIDPILDQKTRTVTVRLEVANPDRRLKPGMLASAVVSAELAAGGRPVASTSGAEPPLVIPASAPLITGRRAVVYVRLPDHEKPTFEGREVVLGPRAGDWYVVESGLAEGERVVTQGNFKIDSAMQIQAKPSMMSPDGGGSAPGHGHGAPGAEDEPAAAGPAVAYDAPAEFEQQLAAVLDGYLALQQALAADDDERAAKAADQTATALAGVDMELLTGDAHMAWMQDLQALKPALAAVREAPDIALRRDRFLLLSEALWSTLRQFGFRGEETLRLFHCPMAFDGDGGDWIQTGTVTANPYYGSQMLRCGGPTDSIPAAGAEGEM